MTKLEDYFKPFRENIVGISQTFQTPFGQKPIIYADWTASGRLYRPIEEKLLNEFGPFVGNTHTEATVTGRAMTKSYRRAHQLIKEHVGAGPEDVIVTQGSGMTGMICKFQRMLGLRLPDDLKEKVNLSPEERPVVFVSHLEHHSNQTSWLETVAEVVVMSPDENGRVSVQSLAKELEKHKKRRYKFGSFSACSNVTGIEMSVGQLARLMHEHGGLCFVDYAASAPYVSINMHPSDPAEKLDAVFFSPHKFLGGPGAPGVLIFDSALYKNKTPDQPGGGTVTWTNPWGGRRYYDDIEIREDGGTPAFLNTIKAALCVELKKQMGVSKMRERKNELLRLLWVGLEKIPGIEILAEGEKKRQGIISFYHRQLHYNLITQLLNDRSGIQARSGCSCAGTYGHYLLGVDQRKSKGITDRIDQGDLSTKPGWVRFSLHPTTTNREIELMLAAVAEIVKRGEEWAGDYRYNRETNEFSHRSEHSWLEEKVKNWFQL